MTILTSNTQGLYWLTRVDSFKHLLNGTAIALLIIIVIITIGSFMSADFDEFTYDKEKLKNRKSTREYFKSKIKWMLPLALSCCIVSVFIPCKNDIIFIVAGGKTMDFVESDTSINKIPAQTTKLITNYLEQQIKEAEK